MKADEKAELKRILKSSFETGPNKLQLLDVLERFVDRNYYSHSGEFRKLVKEIDEAGLSAWKEDFAKLVARKILKQ